MKTKLFALLAVLSASATSLQAVDFVVVNTNATGPGSLAQAINDANALPGPDRIVFNIPGSGVRVIDVSNNYLPKITDPLTIDGYTQPGSSPNTLPVGSNAVVLVRIDGAFRDAHYATVPPPVGIWIDAPDCTVRGLMITRFLRFTLGIHCCSYSISYGIKATDRSVIEGNFIGTDGSESIDLGNGGDGIYVAGADYRIGGTTPAARNMIGGNTRGVAAAGIHVGSSQGGVIIGNQIGRYSPSPAIGGPGTEGAPNFTGIVLEGTFVDTVIGGGQPEARNVISGNTVGISTVYELSGSKTANGIIVQGNLIGAEPPGIGGNEIGIRLFGSNNLIGGTTPGARNLIKSNYVAIGVFGNGNLILGNDVVENYSSGIAIFSSDNVIGGLGPGAGNRIRMNGGVGVGVAGAAFAGNEGKRNRILSNVIEKNGSAAQIDLNDDGRSPNDLGDADTGPNEIQNFPVVATSHDPNGNTVLQGELNSTASSPFTVQLFGVVAGESEQRLLNTQTVTTDANGIAAFQVTYPANVAAESVTATATDTVGNTSEMMPANGPVQLANISTRAAVGTGENIMIGGFIVRSSGQKKIAVRALGPSLSVPSRLVDPSLEIYDSAGALIAKNDDWRAGQQQELMDNGLAPSNDLESALIISLPQGGYTAQVRGAHGESGTAVVEVYDLGAWPADQARLVNLSTRARVGLNDDALIGGLIVRGDARSRVIIRAIGPDLSAVGVNGALQDPTLELRNQNGDVIAANDNWREGSQEQEIISTGIPPADNRDAAIVHSFFPGSFTAVVRGKDNSTGLALVEFYDLN
ncbi:MAG TPA: hypothetical protein VM940_06850 [Chthoniobacterales bacterium]|nr:hypothetical protein [Chthoniobacterales bacterium]